VAKSSLDPGSHIFGFLVFFTLLLCSAFFSGSETALFAVNRLRMRQMHEAGDAHAGVVLRLLEDRKSVV